MKKIFTTILVITLLGAPTIANDEYDEQNRDLLASFLERRANEEADARTEIDPINDPKILAEIAKNEIQDVRWRLAIEKIYDQTFLLDVAKNAPNERVFEAAVKKLLEMKNPYVIQHGDKIIVVNEKGKPYQKTQPKQPLKKSKLSIFLLGAVVFLLVVFGGVIIWKKKT